MEPQTPKEILHSPETTQMPNSFSLEEREFQLKNGEMVRLPSMHIEKMALYHGSSVAGISEFIDSDETTIGDGIYMTSQREAAEGYAVVRGDRSPQQPTLYEAEIADLSIVNLSTLSGRRDFARLFRDEVMPTVKFPTEMVKIVYEERVRRTIEAIDKNNWTHLRDLTFGWGSVVREMLLRQGYDGLMEIEGGEHSSKRKYDIGDHDSYVIFQPNKVLIKKEEPVDVDAIVQAKQSAA